VADRWHLLKNIREALERLLEEKPQCLRAAAEPNQDQQSTAEPQPATETEPTETAITQRQNDEQLSGEARKLTQAEKEKQSRRSRRIKRYQKIQQLHLKGFSNREIGRRLKLNHRTVGKYVKAKTCPQYPSGINRTSKLDPYRDDITQCLKDGFKKATHILSQLRQKGYNGSYSTVIRWLRKEGQSLQLSDHKKEVLPWSPRRAAWLLVKPQEKLNDDESLSLQRMLQASETVACAHTLGQRFAEMIREQKSEALSPWLKDATDSGIDALKQFAKGIKQDFDAVLNALLFKWSNGQLEGQINRLKLIKRQMYGRAKFDLLRKRVLFDPVSAFH
jgi:transposase